MLHPKKTSNSPGLLESPRILIATCYNKCTCSAKMKLGLLRTFSQQKRSCPLVPAIPFTFPYRLLGLTWHMVCAHTHGL